MTDEQKEQIKDVILSILDNVIDGGSPEILFSYFNELLNLLNIDLTVDESLKELY